MTALLLRGGSPYGQGTADVLKLIDAERDLWAGKGGDTEWRVRVGDYRIVYEIDDEARTVDVHVGRLRKALNLPGERDPIRTVRSVGYSFDETFAKSDMRMSG